MLGFHRDELIGRSVVSLFSPEVRAEILSTVRQGKELRAERPMIRRDGTTITVDVHGWTLDVLGHSLRVAAFRDTMSSTDLRHFLHHDALTDLPNRLLLSDRLQQALYHCRRRNRSLAVACLDLDGFGAVNELHGTEVGDALLIAIAKRMKAALRDGDTLARIAGDEFVAVLADMERPQDCEDVLNRLLMATAGPVMLSGRTLQVSASIGVTFYPQDGADAEQLLRHADQAMYLAKQGGKNRYQIFDVVQDAVLKAQRAKIEDVRRGLDQGEFVLHYQPKVNMTTGEVVGAEALIRWQHPDRGLLFPDAFLPDIEAHPISLELGDWVIDAVLTQVGTWRAQGMDLPVSANVSTGHLQQDSFVPRLGEFLAAHPDVPPDRLELEILESSALEDFEMVSERILACQAFGVGFALDDFGTGYSSLSYLRRLPTEMVKIDQSFVRNMVVNREDSLIVRAVVDLAKSLQRHVIAEGVETVEHGRMLLAQGCTLAQGYGIARPMPPNDMLGWKAAWQPDASWTAGGKDHPLGDEKAGAAAISIS
jgi:diguanylate cyclase (GGDEF)-like protein